MRGNEGNAEPCDHCLLDGLVAAHRHADRRTMPADSNNCSIRPRVPEPGSRIKKVSPARSASAEPGFPRQPMRGRRDDDMGMIADQMRGHGDIVWRTAHDRDIEIVAAQRGADFLPVADRKGDVDIRVTFGKSGDRERHEIFRGADSADRDTPGGFPRHHVQRGLGGGDGGLDPLRQRQHLAAGIGQQHAVAGALDQRQACQRLQVADLQRHCGLRQMKLFRGCGDRAVLMHGRQRAQLAQRQFAQKAAGHSRHLL